MSQHLRIFIVSVNKLTHFSEKGDAHMVDVGKKQQTARRAVAAGRIQMSRSTLEQITSRTNKKGDVLAVAQLAGIMASKRTADLIPLCHPLGLTHVAVNLYCDFNDSSVRCEATTETRERTGVEIEALNAVQVALLTVYDMCKAVDRAMTITDIQLIEKSGGRSGTWKRETTQPEQK